MLTHTVGKKQLELIRMAGQGETGWPGTYRARRRLPDQTGNQFQNGTAR